MTTTDGTDQRHRLPQALQDGYFNVDEQSFEALLTMSAQFASALNFFDLDNQKKGTWAALFAPDETVILAAILSTDLKQLEANYLHHERLGAKNQQRYIHQLAARIDEWFKALSTVDRPSAQHFSNKMARVIHERLAVDVHNFGEWVSRSELELDFSGFDRVWGFAIGPGGTTFPRAQIAAPAEPRHQRRVPRATFSALLNGLAYFKSLAPACLNESLQSKRHDPAIGLFIAFLTLFRHAQHSANRFTQNHLDFYYKQVLQATPINPQPASLHLLIQTTGANEALFVPAGTAFSAGKDKALNDVVYCADNDVMVDDAEVQALYTLYCQRDRKISPENELGYITRMKAGRIEVVPLGEQDSVPVAWPLMGADATHTGHDRAWDADIGFAIATPLLLLEEGRRTIDVTVVPEQRNISEEMHRLRTADTEAGFFRQLGRIFSGLLIAGPDWLGEKDRAEILARARSLTGSVHDYVSELLAPDEPLSWLRQHAFHTWLKAMFTARLTTRDGWHSVSELMIKPGNASDGIQFSMTLGPEVGAIVTYDPTVHGGAWPTAQPVIQFTLNANADFFSYSLFNALKLNRIELQTRVQGVKSLLIYNSHGQLDPSKPFQPFGPLPSHHSYLVFGNYEIATKNITDLRVNLEWGELPTAPDGFKRHYQTYDTQFDNNSFTVTDAVLRDGRWLPDRAGEQQTIRLFDTRDDWNKVSPQRTIDLDVAHHFKPIQQSLTNDQFRFDVNARNGFFKLALTGPDGAFGHRDYPPLLSRVLSSNARRRRPQPIPNPPYTPVLNRMSVDYTAKCAIHLDLDRRQDQEPLDEQVFHMHPFGTERIYPETTAGQPHVLPQYRDDGNLFIGIRANRPQQRLTLFFHLAENVRPSAGGGKPDIHWHYLATRGWKQLAPSSVLNDTTDGFLASGIVTLALPDDITRNSQIMPQGLLWLRVSANGDISAMSNMFAVRTHAIRVTRLEHNGAIPTKPDWQPLAYTPAIDKLWPIGPIIGGRAKEDPQQLKTRINERLRHKYRASTPWDYERLILEHFPDVFKVKCFSNVVVGQLQPQPGHVLIAVVPQLTSDESARCAMRLVDPLELKRIKEFVSRISSPFVQVDVRNPVYERIQVRCTVQFKQAIQSGLFINKVNQAITDYLCPWQGPGYRAQFGWVVRRKDIESHIRGLDDVEYVTNFSMLHLTQNQNGKYHLADSAAAEGNQATEIHPRFPWSLAIPARDHFIETTDTLRPIPAEVTGVGELEVGYTFIINGTSRHEEE